MCEFCTQHGEGKKWYLEMKNYSDELLSADLNAKETQFSGTSSRVEWLQRFFNNFVLPATSSSKPAAGDWLTPPTANQSQQSEQEVLEHRKVVHFGQVLPIEDVEEVIDMVNSITRIPCGCRYLTTGKSDQRYCFGIGVDKWGVMGKFPDDASSLEVLEKGEAKRIFREYDSEGLVHSIWTGLTPYVVGLCNCDRDCGAYRRYIYSGGAPTFFRAEYVCQVDIERCNGCKNCMTQCQFGAQFYSSALGKVYIDPGRCFGCGVCRTACSQDAIKLLPRGEVPQAAGLWLKH